LTQCGSAEMEACQVNLVLFLSNLHTHTFNGFLSGTTRVGKTNLDFTEARDSE